MIDIELFSDACWQTPNVLKWTSMKYRGIQYRGYERVVDHAAPFCLHLRRAWLTVSRCYHEQRCLVCNMLLKFEDSGD